MPSKTLKTHTKILSKTRKHLLKTKPMVFANINNVGYTKLHPKRINNEVTPIIKFRIGSCTKYVHSIINEFYLETENRVYYVNTDTNLDEKTVKRKYNTYKDNWKRFQMENSYASMLLFSYLDDNVQYVNMKQNSCYVPHNLDEANKVITELNAQLVLKDIQIELNELQNMSVLDLWIYDDEPPNDILSENCLLLCINYENRCVSSIVLSLDMLNPLHIELLSATEDEMQGRGYNTLLRAVAIIIAKDVWPLATDIVSKGLSPVSAWIMISKFGAKSDITDPDEFGTYIHNNGGIFTNVPLDEEHREIANNVIQKMLRTEAV